jgi:hypothetical protein
MGLWTALDHVHRFMRVLRGVRFVLKWGLAALGAWLLVMLWAERWGWSATIWFLGCPLAYGIYQGLTARRSPRGPSRPAPP